MRFGRAEHHYAVKDRCVLAFYDNESRQCIASATSSSHLQGSGASLSLRRAHVQNKITACYRRLMYTLYLATCRRHIGCAVGILQTPRGATTVVCPSCHRCRLSAAASVIRKAIAISKRCDLGDIEVLTTDRRVVVLCQQRPTWFHKPHASSLHVARCVHLYFENNPAHSILPCCAR
jgi:hypothetical protein